MSLKNQQLLGFGASSASGLILDQYPDDLACAYSLRKLRSAYTGAAIKLREDSGDTTADIGFTSAGDFDTAAATSHLSGAGGFVETWYDQTGNGWDVTEATHANQPAYDASGFLSTPSLAFTGTQALTVASMAYTDLAPNTQPCIFFVGEKTSGSHSILWSRAGSGTARFLLLCHSGGIDYFDVAATDSTGRVNGSTSFGAEYIWSCWRNADDEMYLWTDNTEIASNLSATATFSGTDTWIIGGDTAAPSTYGFNGWVAELIIWKQDIGDTARPIVRDNINDYYSSY